MEFLHISPLAQSSQSIIGIMKDSGANPEGRTNDFFNFS